MENSRQSRPDNGHLWASWWRAVNAILKSCACTTRRSAAWLTSLVFVDKLRAKGPRCDPAQCLNGGYCLQLAASRQFLRTQSALKGVALDATIIVSSGAGGNCFRISAFTWSAV